MKITLSRVFETSKALATRSGQELQDFINFVAEMSEQSLRALRNGLTFEDNVRCLTLTVSCLHNTAQLINTGGKLPRRVILTRVYSTVNALDSFLWYVDNLNRLTIRCGFTGAPAEQISVDLLVFYD